MKTSLLSRLLLLQSQVMAQKWHMEAHNKSKLSFPCIHSFIREVGSGLNLFTHIDFEPELGPISLCFLNQNDASETSKPTLINLEFSPSFFSFPVTFSLIFPVVLSN